MAGVIGRIGTEAAVAISDGARAAALMAFGNNANSNAFTGDGKYVGLWVLQSKTGTLQPFDYGVEIENSAATTGIQIGTATTGINLAGTNTTGISISGQNTTAIDITGGGTVTTGIDIGAATTGINFTGAQTNNIVIETAPTGTAGSILKAGTSSAPLSTATANTNFMQIYTKSTAADAGSDTRGIYNRLYLGGATTGGGESLRSFTTIDDAVVGTAHGAHLSLNFDSTANSAQLTGLGVAGRNTLHIPNDADWTSGTLAAVQAEIWSDGANSDPDGVTELSFIRVVNGGDATGDDDVNTDAFLLSIQGIPDAGGGTGLVTTYATDPTLTKGLRIKIGSTTYYIPLTVTSTN